MRMIAAALLFLSSASSAFAGYVDTPQCRRDLATAERSLGATLRDLDRNKQASTAQRCAAWRRHVEVMRRASVVYRQCSTGRERAENVGQMDGSVADFQEIIARLCR
ncbi:MAG: hypothetical protein ACK4MV_11925 [Beijerinckiaceae bacterium]